MARADEFILSDAERAVRQKRRKRRLVIIGSLAGVLLVGAIVAKPARHAIRGWQARRHAAHAMTLLDQQKFTEARDEATAAYRLQYDEPAAVRAVAQLLSRAGQAEALEFWQKLEALQPLTRDDQRERARVALRVNDLAQANSAVQMLRDSKDGGPQAEDRIIAAEVALRSRQNSRAIELANQVLDDAKAPRREQLQASVLLDSIVRTAGANAGVEIGKVNDRLVALSKGNDAVSLDALIVLASRFAGPAKQTSPLSAEEIESAIENHPAAKTAQKLVAADLRISQQPDHRAEIIQQTVERYKKGDSADLLALAAWLYRNGEFETLIKAIPLERALQTRELFLQHVDALAALKRWNDIRRIIETERFPLDPVIEHMYLARCFAQQDQPQGAANSWERALESAAGDIAKLVMLGDYALKNAAPDVATKAFEAAVNVSPKLRAAQEGRLRAAYQDRDTKSIHAVLLDLLKLWPNDIAIQNDEAYTRLLLTPDSAQKEIKSIEKIANRLIAAEPTSLPHRTLLALALLKENEPYSAFAVYKELNVPRDAVSPSFVAVHAAVSAAAGYLEQAQGEAAHLPMEQLLPEEKALVEHYASKKG